MNRLILLIDEIECETLSKKEVQALTSILDKAIREKTAPVLLSRSLLYNYVARRSYITHPFHRENLELKDSPFYSLDWKVFKIKGTTYYLLIPLEYLRLKKTPLPYPLRGSSPALGLCFDYLADISHCLPRSGDYYRYLRQHLRYDVAPAQTLETVDFSKIFLTKPRSAEGSHAIPHNEWAVYALGHGASKGTIVGTSITTMQRVLNFFDHSLKTKIFYINSCFLGGHNKLLLLPAGRDPYHFTLAVGSIGDSIVVIHSGSISFTDFFKTVETLPAVTTEHFAAACRHLAPCIESKWSSHGISNQPLLLLPYEASFKPLNIDGKMCVLEGSTPSPSPEPTAASARPPTLPSFTGSSAAPSPTAAAPQALRTSAAPAKTLKDDTPPPTRLEKKLAILLYESEYETPLHIAPAAGPISYDHKSTPLAPIPTADMLLVEDLFMKENLINLRLHFPGLYACEKMFTDFLISDTSTNEVFTEMKKKLAPPTTLFPIFISMLTPESDLPSMHHFSSIVIDNEIEGRQTPFFGILRFLRDTFFDASHRVSKNVFFINKLTGFNDFCILKELVRDKEAHHDNFTTALMPYLGKTIILRHVLIETQGRLENPTSSAAVAVTHAMTIAISFNFGGFSWHLRYSGTPDDFITKNCWQFIRLPQEPYRADYQAYVTQQKPYANNFLSYADAARLEGKS